MFRCFRGGMCVLQVHVREALRLYNEGTLPLAQRADMMQLAAKTPIRPTKTAEISAAVPIPGCFDATVIEFLL